MKLNRILSSLNYKNIKYLYYKLKKSKDKKSKQIILLMCKGMDIFDAIKSQIDNYYGFILESKEPINLIFLAKTMINKNEVNKKLKNILFYPLILSILMVCSLLIINQVIEINFYELLVPLFLILCINIYYYYIINKKFNFLIKSNIVIMFLKNEISFKTFNKIIKYLDPKINTEYTSVENIIFQCTNIQVNNYDEFIHICKEEDESFHDFCDLNYKKISIFNILVISLYTAYVFLNFMYQNMSYNI